MPARHEDLLLLEHDFPYGPPEKHAERLARQDRGLVAYLVAWYCPAGERLRPVGHGLLTWGGAVGAHIASMMRGTCPDVEDLFVLEAFRSRGVGSRILQEAETLAAARGFRRIGLSVDVRNPRAHALYTRLGYRDAGLGSHHEEGDYVDRRGVLQRWDETCVYLVKWLASLDSRS
jgi:GNAT superfamily N-acetyltransferase